MARRAALLACSVVSGVLCSPLPACDEKDGCRWGCEEDRGDCNDDPASYDNEARCQEGMPADVEQCQAQLCDEVYDTCAEQCETIDLKRAR